MTAPLCTTPSARMMAALSTIYGDWLKAEGLPNMSADELMCENVSDAQYLWLGHFCAAWDAVCAIEQLEFQAARQAA